jgi:hypothetical protein
MEEYTVWIGAEQWAPGQWIPDDDLTDAVVTFSDGSRWVATFCAFRHVETLRRKFAGDGEYLGGKYVWLSDLILVDNTSRASLEAVIKDLLASGEFQSAFDQAPVENDAPAV